MLDICDEDLRVTGYFEVLQCTRSASQEARSGFILGKSNEVSDEADRRL